MRKSNPAAVAKRYAEHDAQLKSQLRRLEELRAAHAADLKQNPTHWGLVGDLGRVTDLLDQVLLALGAGEDGVNADRARRDLDAL